MENMNGCSNFLAAKEDPNTASGVSRLCDEQGCVSPPNHRASTIILCDAYSSRRSVLCSKAEEQQRAHLYTTPLPIFLYI
jgi:hypothetical protein